MSAEQSTPDDTNTGVAINAGACVHAMIADASCQACVEACPFGAWRLDDDGLGFDEELCERCGVCASACPNHAISVETGEALVDASNPREAYAACRNAVEGETHGQLSCLGILGLDELMQLYAQGIRTITVPDPALASCHCGAPSRFTEAVSRLNAALHSRNAPGLTVIAVAAELWTERAGAAAADRFPADRSRRSFFSTLLGDAGKEPRAAIPPGAAINVCGHTSEALFAHVPQLDLRRCTGCDTCVRICGSESLTLIKDDAGNECYQVDPSRCTGCGLCVDICTVAALRVDDLSSGGRRRVELSSAKCRNCGAPYHRPAVAESKDGLCVVCAGARRHPALFQVLE